LTEVDKFHTSKSGIVVDYANMTIEHIASENPSDGHPAKNVGKLGNLLLVENGFNSHELSNLSFAEKKKKLLESKVWLDSDLEEAETWHDREIEART
jgi:hypothetical protein